MKDAHQISWKRLPHDGKSGLDLDCRLSIVAGCVKATVRADRIQTHTDEPKIHFGVTKARTGMLLQMSGSLHDYQRVKKKI